MQNDEKNRNFLQTTRFENSKMEVDGRRCFGFQAPDFQVNQPLVLGFLLAHCYA